MVIVDSSVWIEVLRGKDTHESAAFERMAAEEEIALADLSLFEILQGVKAEAAFHKVQEQLRVFTVVPIGGESAAVSAARKSRALKNRGVQASAADCLLASYCIDNDVRFLTADKDFAAFARYLGLDVIR